MADLDLASAKRKKREVNAEIKSTQNEIAILQRKIDRLDAVKKKVSSRKTETKRLKDNSSKKNVAKKLSLSWKGNQYDSMGRFLDGTVKYDFDNYIKAIDSCLDSIVDKITYYENAILRKRTILSGLWTTLNDLSAWIEKTFN